MQTHKTVRCLQQHNKGQSGYCWLDCDAPCVDRCFEAYHAKEK